MYIKSVFNLTIFWENVLSLFFPVCAFSTEIHSFTQAFCECNLNFVSYIGATKWRFNDAPAPEHMIYWMQTSYSMMFIMWNVEWYVFKLYFDLLRNMNVVACYVCAIKMVHLDDVWCCRTTIDAFNHVDYVKGELQWEEAVATEGWVVKLYHPATYTANSLT